MTIQPIALSLIYANYTMSNIKEKMSYLIFSGTTYKLQFNSTIGTKVWRKAYIFKYVNTLLQLISTVTLKYFANIRYGESSLNTTNIRWHAYSCIIPYKKTQI